MSVIPLTIGGPQATVVQHQAEFGVEGGAVLIGGLDVAQLNQPGTSNTSYDLRIGRQCRDHSEQAVKDIPDQGVVILQPGSALIIQTEETLHLPRRMFGTIAPKVSLLERGLSSTFSKVDPGYNGHLLITLFNLGKTTVNLQRGQPFCALTLFEVAQGARLYDKGAKQITAQLTRQPRRTMREWLELHHIGVMIALILATLLLFVEHLFTFIWSLQHR